MCLKLDDLGRPCGLPLPNRAEAVDDSPGSGLVRLGCSIRYEQKMLLKRVHTFKLLLTSIIEKTLEVSDSDAVVRDPGTGS